MITSEGLGVSPTGAFSCSVRNSMEIRTPPYQPNSSPRIYVVCQACDDGYGDYAFACKMGNFLSKITSHCQVILSGIDAPTHQKLLNFASTRKLYCTLANKSIDFRRLLPSEMQNSLIIHGPFLKEPLSLPHDFPQKNVWHIGEYSNEGLVHESIPHTYSCGLGSDEWGIFGCASKSDLNIKRRSFGNFLLDAYIPADSDEPCYLAYCYDHCTVLSFIRILVSAHQDSTDLPTITLCVPGDRKKIGFHNLIEEIPRILANETKAPRHLECIWLNPRMMDPRSERASSPFMSIPKKRKERDISPTYSGAEQCSVLRWEFPGDRQDYKLQILFPGFLSQEDMQKLSVHSKCSCITGDQSFSDHLGKPILYECRPHKSKFFMQTIELVKKHHLQKLAKFWEDTHPFISGPADFKMYGPMNTQTIQTIKLMKDPELQQEFKTFGRIVQNSHNLISKVAREFQKWQKEHSLGFQRSRKKII